jgi:hypothetical protein
LGDLGVDRRIILKWILSKKYARIWTDINVTQGTIQWQALVNIVKRLQFP